MATDNKNNGKDVLLEVLLNSEQEHDPELRELLCFIDKIGTSFPPEQRGRAGKKKGRRRVTKKRFSSYLSPKNFEALDQAKEECQRILASGKSLRVSKSKITDFSLEIILQDFHQHGKNSILARKLREYAETQG